MQLECNASITGGKFLRRISTNASEYDHRAQRARACYAKSRRVPVDALHDLRQSVEQHPAIDSLRRDPAFDTLLSAVVAARR